MELNNKDNCANQARNSTGIASKFVNVNKKKTEVIDTAAKNIAFREMMEDGLQRGIGKLSKVAIAKQVDFELYFHGLESTLCGPRRLSTSRYAGIASVFNRLDLDRNITGYAKKVKNEFRELIAMNIGCAPEAVHIGDIDFGKLNAKAAEHAKYKVVVGDVIKRDGDKAKAFNDTVECIFGDATLAGTYPKLREIGGKIDTQFRNVDKDFPNLVSIEGRVATDVIEK